MGEELMESLVVMSIIERLEGTGLKNFDMDATLEEARRPGPTDSEEEEDD